MSPKHKIIYILGASHSGTTLFSMLLNSIDGICSVGELKIDNISDPDTYLCSCRSPVAKCSFWTSVVENMNLKGYEYSLSSTKMHFSHIQSAFVKRLLRPLHKNVLLEMLRDFLLFLSPEWRCFLPVYLDRSAAYSQAIMEVAGANIIADSSKIGIRLKYLLKNNALDVKVIWVVRDARGVALAYRNPSEFADASNPALRGGGSGITLEHSRQLVSGAEEWVKCNEEAESLIKLLPEDGWMRIRYEDLCENTDSILEDVARFVGLDSESVSGKGYRETDHHILGNGMRLDETPIRLDERWRTELNDEEKRRILQIAKNKMVKYGYQI